VVFAQAWRREGVTEDNKLTTTWEEMKVFPIPAAIYLVKNLMQYVIFLYVDAPSYQILKNLNIITTGVLYRIFLKKHLTPVQWSALILLALGCTIAQTTSQSEQVPPNALLSRRSGASRCRPWHGVRVGSGGPLYWVRWRSSRAELGEHGE
jgi:UDP-sugar transporter A1/2/3